MIVPKALKQKSKFASHVLYTIRSGMYPIKPHRNALCAMELCMGKYEGKDARSEVGM